MFWFFFIFFYSTVKTWSELLLSKLPGNPKGDPFSISLLSFAFFGLFRSLAASVDFVLEAACLLFGEVGSGFLFLGLVAEIWRERVVEGSDFLFWRGSVMGLGIISSWGRGVLWGWVKKVRWVRKNWKKKFVTMGSTCTP